MHTALYFSCQRPEGRFFSSVASERYTRIWDAKKKTAIQVHRIVAEEYLGRPLALGEECTTSTATEATTDQKDLKGLLSQGHHMALEKLQWKVERGIEPLFDFENLPK